LTDADQELYKNFPLIVSDRWQNEIAETVFEVVNQEADKVESKRRHRPRADEPDEIGMIYRPHCSELGIIHGPLADKGGMIYSSWWQNVVSQEAKKVEYRRRHRPCAKEPDEIGMIQPCRIGMI